jgi:methionine sulfoxide reductase heme-binding subunit
MSRRVIIALTPGVHLLCLTPLIWLVRFCTSAHVFLNPDPVKFIIHFTGNWAIYLLLMSLFLLLLGKITTRAPRLIRFHRLTGSYAFFYATLHLLMYFLIYSGYDFVAVFAGFHTGHPGVLVAELKAVLPAVFEDFRKRQFLAVGVVAWALLLVSPVSSQRFLQHASDGKTWQHLYGFIYVATIAALIHSWWFVVSSVSTSGGRCVDVSRTAAISDIAEKEQRSQPPGWKQHDEGFQ